MHASDISIHTPAELRRVGITFPDRTQVMDTAINILAGLGFDFEVEDLTISIEVPRAASSFYMGAIERYTGKIAWNQWEKP